MKLRQPDPIATLFLFLAFTGLAVAVLLRYPGFKDPKFYQAQVENEAWNAGALAVINYERGVEGLPGFSSWGEFEAYAKETNSRKAGLNSFFTELNKNRAERDALKKAHPPIGWSK
jgi:hypothetical protein